MVVPRPIAWVSTWGPNDVPNLAPFSYFAALSSSPALVGVSVGARGDGAKDTLTNIRARGGFCVNVVSEPYLEAMNATSAEVAPDVSEFELAELGVDRSGRVDAPYVRGCPAVLECAPRQEVALPGSRNVLVVAEVVGVLLEAEAAPSEGYAVDPRVLKPVGRLGGIAYALPRKVREIPRP